MTDLLCSQGLCSFDIIKPDFEETLDKSQFSHPSEYCKATAMGKATAVAQHLQALGQIPLSEHRATLIIASDTIVVESNGSILEKPCDVDHAKEMLQMLSGKQCSVFSSVALLTVQCHPTLPKEIEIEERVFADETLLTFHSLSDAFIADYVASGEPMDKAGGFGIQGRGGVMIRRLEGCFWNVVGLPIPRLVWELGQFV
jgi:septum formation protein